MTLSPPSLSPSVAAPRGSVPCALAIAALLLVTAFGAAPGALAQAPAAVKPLTLVVPVPPGGSIDFTARVLQERLPEKLGAAVVVENKPGASGSIAAAQVAKAAPDGTSLLLAFDTHATNGIAYRNLPYDTFRDFVPVMQLVSFPLVFGVPASIPANTLSEFAELARASAGRWNYGTAGKGTLNHLGVELYKSQAGVDLVHVPYKGGAPALQGLLSGDVQLFLGSYAAINPHVKAGKAKILAVASNRRYSVAPELPTAAEQGFPQFQVSTWIGAFAPAGTPAAVIARQHEALKAVLAEREVRDKIAAQGLEIVAGTSDELAALVRAEHDKWAAVIKRANITFD
jgi:tripartite-type tricarboxylate transporter receptor subunit TctC